MGKQSPRPPQEAESLIIIPDNYDVERVVPICIRTIDDYGQAVHRGWIDAVRPIADTLRNLARRFTGEVWRVSELAEGSVHALNRKHGENLGHRPEARIYADARWRVKDIAAGSRRARSNRDVELKDYVLSQLIDPEDFGQAYEDRELLERIRRELVQQGKTELMVMVNMHLTGSQDLIPEVFGIEPNSPARNRMSKRFRRGMDSVLASLKLTSKTR